jgi:hypothetical protein
MRSAGSFSIVRRSTTWITKKEDTASPPAQTVAIQRERFAAFQQSFNEQ